MAGINVQKQSKTGAGSSSVGSSLLEQAIGASKQTQRSEAEELLKNLTAAALEGTVTWDRNLSQTIKDAVKKIDQTIAKQVREIVQTPEFLKLEGTWRGVQHLVDKISDDTSQSVKLLNASKKEISKDLSKSMEFDQSELFKKVYEDEFGTPGGVPYGTLLGDYEFTNAPEDIEFLTRIGEVAAASFCPFISSVSENFFDFESWDELSRPKDLAKITDSGEYSKWRTFRDSEAARFVTLTMPRVLARAPYTLKNYRNEKLAFSEIDLDKNGKALPLPHDKFCWMNAAYILVGKMQTSFAENGWCTAIRGAESGGKITGLPTYEFKTDEGDMDMQCPTEVGITDRREAELSKMGLLPLCHYKNTDYAVFFGAQTAHRPKNLADPSDRANDEVASRLPYNLVASRVAHYLKIMARDKIGSMMQVGEVQAYLSKWLSSHVNSNPASAQDLKFRYPLAEAKVEVVEVEGRPGSYNAVAWLKPWLALEELSTSLRLVANIPAGGAEAGGAEGAGGEGGDEGGGEEGGE
jgi:type VI secretion system protein ImpC